MQVMQFWGMGEMNWGVGGMWTGQQTKSWTKVRLKRDREKGEEGAEAPLSCCYRPLSCDQESRVFHVFPTKGIAIKWFGASLQCSRVPISDYLAVRCFIKKFFT